MTRLVLPLRRRLAALVPAVALAALAIGGCDGEGAAGPAAAVDGTPVRERVSPPEGPEAPARLGAGEGRLRLIAPSAYVEAAGTAAFERATGCRVTATPAAGRGEVLRLLRSGRYDGVAAGGDVALGVIGAGLVAPVDLGLIPNAADVVEGLRDRAFNTVGGRSYGVPQGRSADVLLWRRDRIPGSPRSLDAVFVPAQIEAYRGQVTVRDDPMSIAEAALWLRSERRELGITDPYELTPAQLQAAVEALRTQRHAVGYTWRTPSRLRRALRSGSAIVATGSPAVAERLRTGAEPVPVFAVLPREGAVGRADTWMVAARARHPMCMYRWMDHVLSPEVNARIAEATDQAPANLAACELTADPQFCETHHAGDEGYWRKVEFWATPTRECGDARGAACTGYADWVRAWRTVGS